MDGFSIDAGETPHRKQIAHLFFMLGKESGFVISTSAQSCCILRSQRIITADFKTQGR